MKYATIDIETDANGQPTDLGYYDGEEIFITTSIVEFVEKIWTNGEVTTFYAHAGMRFDYCILYPYLLRLGDSLQISVAGTQGISITVIKGRKQIRLLDSFRLLPASLMKLSKQFDVDTPKQNLEVMPWELSQVDRQAYLRDDCISLYQVVTKFWSIIDDYTGKTIRAVTLPALALKIFQQCYLPDFLATTDTRNKKINTSSGKLTDFEQASYFGGCVWASAEYAGIELDVLCYDFNSMYPWCMLGDYPYSYVGAWTCKFKSKSVGLWLVNFKEKSTEAPPFIFDVNDRCLVYEGQAILDTKTVLYLKATGAEVQVIKGYVYEQTGELFKDFVLDFYNLRLTFGNQSAMGFTAKILLNSLYGKFGEKPIKRGMSTKQPTNPLSTQIHAVMDAEGNWMEIYDFESEVFIKHRFPAIASMVTLSARLALRQASDKVICEGGTVIYCDTDSLHVVDKNYTYFNDSAELGGLKLEFSGPGIYLGKKIYQWYRDGVPYKSVAKGIPNRSCDFDFRTIERGRRVNFTSFSTLLEVVRGDNFKLVQKHRLLRRTV